LGTIVLGALKRSLKHLFNLPLGQTSGKRSLKDRQVAWSCDYLGPEM